MDFKGNYRLEAVYFDKLKRNINESKRLMESGDAEKARFLLEDAVDADGAVLLLYRNLGEVWSELAAKIEETNKALQDLDEKTEAYHDELNEKIDEINNYLNSLIRGLDERLTAAETWIEEAETRISTLEECCEQVQEELENKQDKLTAGQNITIIDNVISATGGGGSADLFLIMVKTDAQGNYVSDKTYSEIDSAIGEKKFVILSLSNGYSCNLYLYDYNDGQKLIFNSVEPYYDSYYDSLETSSLGINQDNSISFLDPYQVMAYPKSFQITANFSGGVYTLDKNALFINNIVAGEGADIYIYDYDSSSNTSTKEKMISFKSKLSSPQYFEIKTPTKTFTANAENEFPTYTP